MARLPFEGHYPVTQEFGERPWYYARWGLAGHNGVDFGLPDGTPVVSASDGEVVEVGDDPTGYGYYVKVRTPDGEDWLYAHLNLWELPAPGTWVAEGHRLGYSGSTGNSTGPHLHLGWRPDHTVRGWPYNGYAEPPLVMH